MDVQELFARTRAEARDYQARIVAQAVEGFIDKGYASILVDSPTGSGKTIMALAVAKMLQEQHGARVAWVAMRRNLLTQVKEENATMGFNVEMSVISMFDRKPPSDFDLLVVDEAQHDVTGSMGHLHALIAPRWVLGLSATPFRVDRVKLCFDKVLKDAGIHRLIQDGYLSRYHHYSLPDWEPDTVVKYYLEDRERWGKSLMYFNRLADCYKTWQSLCDHGVSCDVVSGNNPCEKQLEAFARGNLQVLINCMKLGEGFNSPDLKTVWCRPSVKSVTIQMAGRVLRKHPSCVFKQVVQSNDTRWNFCRTAGAALMFTYAEGEWRSIQPNDASEEASRRALVALAQADAPIPALLRRQAEKDRAGRLRRQGSGAAAREDGNPGNMVPVPDVQDIEDGQGEFGI